MNPKDFFNPRFIVTADYPHSEFVKGDVIDAFWHDDKLFLHADVKIEPAKFPLNFESLPWYAHRTIEQLLSIKYMKVVKENNYYVQGDIVEVTEMRYNDQKLVGGKDNILFSLKGHYFAAARLEPATKEEHDRFWQKEEKG